MQARTPNGGSRSWGQFIPLQTGDSKVIQCQNGLTLTHTANNDKNIVRFAWIPEPGMREQVQFVYVLISTIILVTSKQQYIRTAMQTTPITTNRSTHKY